MQYKSYLNGGYFSHILTMGLRQQGCDHTEGYWELMNGICE